MNGGTQCRRKKRTVPGAFLQLSCCLLLSFTHCRVEEVEEVEVEVEADMEVEVEADMEVEVEVLHRHLQGRIWGFLVLGWDR